jgi:hypothetical protein
MPTPNSERVDRHLIAIEMSAIGQTRWKAMLTARKIGTAKKLLARVPEISTEPTARRAFNGQKLDRQTWEAIFYGLNLDRADFFTDVQWFDRNLNTQWELLWKLAQDAGERFGLILAENLPAHDGIEPEKFVRTIVSRTSGSIEIPAGLTGYLLLLERDASGTIVMLSPSPLIATPLLSGAVQRLPQSPPSPFPYLQPLTVGTTELWAGIFAKSPDWRWLATAQKKPLRLDLAQLTEIYESTRKQHQSTQILRSSYVVTD